MKGDLVKMWTQEVEEVQRRTMRELDMMRYGYHRTKEFRRYCGQLALDRLKAKRDAS